MVAGCNTSVLQVGKASLFCFGVPYTASVCTVSPAAQSVTYNLRGRLVVKVVLLVPLTVGLLCVSCNHQGMDVDVHTHTCLLGM